MRILATLLTGSFLAVLTFSGCAAESPPEPGDESASEPEAPVGEAQQALCYITCTNVGYCGSLPPTSFIYHCVAPSCDYDYYVTCVPWRGQSYCASTHGC